MKAFTQADIVNHGGGYQRIYADSADLVDSQPDWMKRGLQQTASGYGKQLNTGRKINFNGKLYRLYATCFSNVASIWFTVRGTKIYVS